jgi:hypothetical protein
LPAEGISNIPLASRGHPDRLDDDHRLERERIHLLLIDDAQRGLADIEAGRSYGADAAIAQLQQRRAAAAAGQA